MTKTNAINFINNINSNPQQTFRSLAAIGFTPKAGLTGKLYTQNYGNKAKTAALVHTDDIVFGLKFVAMKDVVKNDKLIGGFMLVRSQLTYAPLNIIVPLTLTSAIPADIDFPQDGHLRWRTSAPITGGFLYGYLTHGDQILVIDPNTLGLDSRCVDIQTVFAAGRYNLSFLTEKGTVYVMQVKTNDVVTNGKLPKIQKLKDNVTTLLTVPHKGEMIAFYGTTNGVYFGNELIKETKDFNVVNLVVDSENPRIFLRTDKGKIFAIPVDNNFMVITGKLIAIDDTMQTNEQLFAGPAVQIDDNTAALLAINWVKQNEGFTYSERTIAVPQLPRIPNVNPHL